MYLLDTNVISLLDERRQSQAPQFIDWLERNGAVLFLSVMTVAEMEAGILKLRRENKTARADELAALQASILADFGDRVLPVDTATALHVAQLAESARPTVVDTIDLIIAATARRHGLIVLTRNVRHFLPTGVLTIDPVADLPPDA